MINTEEALVEINKLNGMTIPKDLCTVFGLSNVHDYSRISEALIHLIQEAKLMMIIRELPLAYGLTISHHKVSEFEFWIVDDKFREDTLEKALVEWSKQIE